TAGGKMGSCGSCPGDRRAPDMITGWQGGVDHGTDLLPLFCPSCGSAHQPGQKLDAAGSREAPENPCAGSGRAVTAGVSTLAKNRASHVAFLERVFERVLWDSRLIVLVAVVASLLVGAGMFLLGTVDAVHLIRDVGAYPWAMGEAPEEVRTQIVGRIVELIDGYLLATMMLIFAFGLYELFISRIDPARGNELSSRLLLIRSMDDLKD